MTPASVVSPVSPYKGLTAFDASDLDASFFFGRERETTVIAANVMAARFTVLYGPLGVGKSSVLRAGVARRLRSLAPDAVVVDYDSWAGDAVGGLLRAVAAGVGVAQPPRDTSLADGLADLAARSGSDLYLLLDQFEEVFVYPAADRLAASLAEVVTRPDLRIDVLLALREDALAELDIFTGLVPNVFGNYLPLDRLDREAARAAVTGPVARFNELSGTTITIEDELVEAVLDQVEVGRVLVGGPNGAPAREPGTGAVEAPYLQLVLERLWEAEARQGSKALRRKTLDDLGGAQAIVEAHLAEALQALSPGEQDVAVRVFNHLVTPSGTKIAHGAQDLAEYAGVGEEEIQPVLASLGDSRILRPVDGRFEIYHDVLAGAVLAWRTRHEGDRALERQRAEADKRHRRLLALLVASLVILGVMAAVAVYALAQRSEAREQAEIARAEARRAQASRLAAEASVLIPSAQAELESELALALAAEATRLAPTPRAVNTLRRALLLSHLRAVVPEDGVEVASFSPDGEQLAVGTADGTVAVYGDDARTRLTAIELGNPVTGVSFSSDGDALLTTERGGPATVWDSETGASLRALGDAPTSASFSADGSLVLTVEPDATRTWQAADGSLVATLRQPEAVREATFDPAGSLVATVGPGSVARVFDAQTGRLRAAVDHGDRVTSAVITPDGERLVTTGADRVARVWSVGDDSLVHELEGHRGPLTAGVVAPDGTHLVTTSADGTARSWEIATGRPVAVLIGHAGRVDGAAFSPDSALVVTWGSGPAARVGSPLSTIAQAYLAGHGDGVVGASFDSSGDVVVTTGVDGKARLWRPRDGAELLPLGQVSAPVSAAAFSADGSTAAAAGPTAVELLATGGGEPVAEQPASGASVLAIDLDGSLVAAADGSRVSSWEVGVDEPAGVVEAGAEATALALTDDGLLAVGDGAGAISLWSAAGSRVTELAGPGGRVTALGLDREAGRLAAGFDDGTVALWSLPDSRLLFERVEHRRGRPVLSAAFSSDGSRLVTAGADSTARVWEAATGRVLYTLRGHSGAVRSAAFSPGGEWIVTTANSRAGVWDTSTRQRLVLLEAAAPRLLAASFAPGGRTILALGSDGTLSSYACEVCAGVDDLLALADERLAAVGRELTPEERRHYLGDDVD